MLAWLEHQLAGPVFHQTAFPISQHIGDPIDVAARAQFVPILERRGVQAVFAGHEHNYARSKPMRDGVPVTSGPGTIYMTSGGGGVSHPLSPQPFLDQQFSVLHYLRVEVNGGTLTIHAIGADGKEFDHLILTQPVLAAPDAVVNGASFTPDLATGASSAFSDNRWPPAPARRRSSRFPSASPARA